MGLPLDEQSTVAPAPAGAPRLQGLDGLRGLAALYVVENHIFLRAFPGYPVNHAPWWAAEFIYGRFAVVVFIVLSGFCLAAGPARSGWRMNGLADFARRRAWRILPAYWAALGFSLIMTWYVVAQPGWPVPTGRSVLVNAGLVQDAFVVPSPNRAFWSIAIEAQLYLVFPLLILLARRLSPAVMVALVGIPVAYLGVLAARGEPVASHLVNQYTPDLGVLFAVGVAAAGALTHAASRTRPWVAYAVALAVPPVVLITATGSAWTINHLFWVDLAIGPAIACLLLAAATGQGPRLQRALDSGPVRRLGAISYSLYLTHAPIVIALYYGWLRGRVEEGVPMFLLLTVVTIPITVAFARLFAAVFELPFQRHRGWTALRDSLRLRTVAHGDDAAERAQIRAAVRPERQPRIVVVEAESGAG